jgi:ADP-ribosylglycohydrolase
MTLRDRARGALIGLAVGDALGAPTEGKTPAEIAGRWGRVTDFLADDQGGSDDTEYALFSARLLLLHGRGLTSAAVAEAWRSDIVNASNAHKGAGFSEMMTIRNLRDGLEPPASGRHLHSWSDGLAMRTAPFGIAAAGDPRLAADLAARDGAVSHAGEGIYGGQAVAAAVAVAMAGAPLDEILRAATGVVPAESWTANAIATGVKIGSSSADVWSALEPLHSSLACGRYFWPDIAPEAVGLAFGIVAAARGNFTDAVTGAVNIGRDTDTIAAIAGAVCGAMQGESALPERWRGRVSSARGICIASVRGMSVTAVADDLARLAESWKGAK